MNPLTRYIGIKFSKLDANQLGGVISEYVNSNHYEHYPPSNLSVQRLKKWFENKYYPIEELKYYYDRWTS